MNEGKWDARWVEALGLWVYTSPQGEDFVPRTPGLSHLRLTKREQSGAVKRVEKVARKQQRALNARGLA